MLHILPKVQPRIDEIGLLWLVHCTYFAFIFLLHIFVLKMLIATSFTGLICGIRTTSGLEWSSIGASRRLFLPEGVEKMVLLLQRGLVGGKM